MSKNDPKFTFERYVNSNESVSEKWITASFISVISYILSVIKMNSFNEQDEICDKSYATIAKFSRTSVSTVKRVLKIAMQHGLIDKLEINSRNGQVNLAAGQWFIDREKIVRCGTAVNKSVDKSPPPAHHDLPTQVTMTYPLGHSELHIHTALQTLNTKKLKSKQPVYFQDKKQRSEKMKPGLEKIVITPNEPLDEALERKKNLQALKELAQRIGKSHEINHNIHDLNEPVSR